MKVQRILAADIGGTHARFAACEVGANLDVRPGPVFRFPTRQPGVDSFATFWAAVRAAGPAEWADADAFDAIALAVAGSVDDAGAILPAIGWDIRSQDTGAIGNVHLLNDFVAQGFALAAGGSPDLEAVRTGPEPGGAIAVVGAGTGLGHCALHPRCPATPEDLPWAIGGSEAGHANFPFCGTREKALEEKLLALSGKSWLTNDDVVSGPGAARLHEALTGNAVTPAEALQEKETETSRWFARFYARACRNYCLNIFPVSRLIVSGGLAAHNPHLLRSPVFLGEFEDAAAYRNLLRRIPVWLNTDQDIGIRGAAVFAARKLRFGTA